MRFYLFIFIISFCYSNFSYQSLLLPNSNYDLVSGYSQYSIFNKFTSDKKNNSYISSSILSFPKGINLHSIEYFCFPFNYHNYFNINIIDYGQFTDSESDIQFSAQDIILKNYLTIPIKNKFYTLVGLNYINSNIANYSSSALCINFSLFIDYKNLLLQAGFNNYGLIIKHYTSYNEVLPMYKSLSIMYRPQYLNSIIGLQYNSFDYYNMSSFFGELFISDNYSIIAGYTSLAQKLYFEDFSTNFFTGFSIGLNVNYRDYILNIGIKNLGSIGLINSITLNKSFN